MAYYALEKLKAYLKEPSDRQQLPPFKANWRINAPELYQPSPELADAVNVALRLGLPLLLTGEPGSGKTELAKHLAWYFNLGEPKVFHAQTTSQANDLFYHYDALGHFQYSQSSKEPLSADELERRFIRYRGLGAAIKAAKEEKQRSVVLIDEIDKAPRDLPNDVLDAIDKLRFYVAEADKWYGADGDTANAAFRPLIIMTSNSEKNLPDAFLRRVVYFHIEFPDPARMLEIISAKVTDLAENDLKAILDHFYAIRDARSTKLNKYPATAELIQWACYLQETGFPVAKLKNTDRLSDDERKALVSSYAILAKTREDLLALIRRLEN